MLSTGFGRSLQPCKLLPISPIQAPVSLLAEWPLCPPSYCRTPGRPGPWRPNPAENAPHTHGRPTTDRRSGAYIAGKRREIGSERPHPRPNRRRRCRSGLVRDRSHVDLRCAREQAMRRGPLRQRPAPDRSRQPRCAAGRGAGPKRQTAYRRPSHPQQDRFGGGVSEMPWKNCTPARPDPRQRL